VHLGHPCYLLCFQLKIVKYIIPFGFLAHDASFCQRSNRLIAFSKRRRLSTNLIALIRLRISFLSASDFSFRVLRLVNPAHELCKPPCVPHNLSDALLSFVPHSSRRE
jgi:hypothetical protein